MTHDIEWKEIEGLDHTHLIHKDNDYCSTCGLTEEVFRKLDELNKTHIPYSKWCSECGVIIEPQSRFKNFALKIGTCTLHTVCENCRIRLREIRGKKLP